MEEKPRKTEPDQRSTSFGELVERSVFVVPVYQRPYDWDDKACIDMWNDIMYLLDPSNPGNDHYCGTLLFKMTSEELLSVTSDKLPKKAIVDGQQRMTSLLTLLSAMRWNKKCGQFQQVAIDRILKTEVLSHDGQSTTSFPRLTLDPELHPVFEDIMAGRYEPGWNDPSVKRAEEKSRGHAALIKAYQTFRVLLQDWVHNEANIFRLLDTIKNKLAFGIYYGRDEEHEELLFECLNDRGRRLTDPELIKSCLFRFIRIHRLGNDMRNLTKETFNNVQKDLFAGNKKQAVVNESTLFRQHWSLFGSQSDEEGRVIRSGFKLWQQHGGFGAVKKFFFESVWTPATAEAALRSYCDTIGRAATFMRYTLCWFGENHGHPLIGDPLMVKELGKRAQNLDHLGTTFQHYSLFLSQAMGPNPSWNNVAKLMTWMEIYSFRVFHLANKRSNTGQQLFEDLAIRLWCGRGNNELMDKAEQEILKSAAQHSPQAPARLSFYAR